MVVLSYTLEAFLSCHLTSLVPALVPLKEPLNVYTSLLLMHSSDWCPRQAVAH